MKLTKKEKQRLIGKKIVVGEVLEIKKVRVSCIVRKREIKTVKIKTPIKAIIIGFTFKFEGKIEYVDSEVGCVFICEKRIPCMKIATGIVGKIQYAPIRLRPSTLLSVCERRDKK